MIINVYGEKVDVVGGIIQNTVSAEAEQLVYLTLESLALEAPITPNIDWRLKNAIEGETTATVLSKAMRRKLKGGPGSGHHGHKGIPGHRGGSQRENGSNENGSKWERIGGTTTAIIGDVAAEVTMTQDGYFKWALYNGDGTEMISGQCNTEYGGMAWCEREALPESEQKPLDRLIVFALDDPDTKNAVVGICQSVGKPGSYENCREMLSKMYDAISFSDEETGMYIEINSIHFPSHSDSVEDLPFQVSVDGKVLQKGRDDPVGDVSRIFYVSGEGELIVDNALLYLKVERGNGFGTRFYEKCETSFRAMGVKAIRLYANISVGGYAWARMGFSFENPLEQARIMAKLSDLYLGVTGRFLGDDYPKSSWDDPWEIAAFTVGDRHIGKEVLLGDNWDAIKRLDGSNPGFEVGRQYYRAKKRKTKEANSQARFDNYGVNPKATAWDEPDIDSEVDDEWRRLMTSASKELASRLSTALKGGKGSGNHGHVGIQGHRGGSAPTGTSAPTGASSPYQGLSNEAIQEIESGALDAPKAVLKRKYQTQTQDKDMLAYAEKVWNSAVAEMKRQGVTDEDIKLTERALYHLLSSNSRPGAKTITAAMMAADGASEEEIRAMATTEVGSRYRHGYFEPLMKLGEMVASGKSEWDPEVFMQYCRVETRGNEEWAKERFDNNIFGWEAVQQEMKYEQERDPKRFEEYGWSQYGSYVRSGLGILEDIDNIVKEGTRPGLVKAAAILRDYSQKLYDRNGESQVLYRGIYDYGEERDYYKKGETEENYWPVKSIGNVLYPLSGGAKPLGDEVTINCDRMVAWTVSKQIARTFSAGGGRRGSGILGKGMITSPISGKRIALYWPVIYHNLGMSIDTKEIWIFTNGEMTISKEEFSYV